MTTTNMKRQREFFDGLFSSLLGKGLTLNLGIYTC